MKVVVPGATCLGEARSAPLCGRALRQANSCIQLSKGLVILVTVCLRRPCAAAAESKKSGSGEIRTLCSHFQGQSNQSVVFEVDD